MRVPASSDEGDPSKPTGVALGFRGNLELQEVVSNLREDLLGSLRCSISPA